MYAVSVGGLYHNVVRSLDELRVADKWLLGVADVARECNGLGDAVLCKGEEYA